MSKRIATVADGYVVASAADVWTLLLCTIRYAMGRRSYITGSAADLFRTYCAALTTGQRLQIAREIREETALQERLGRTLGDACDHSGWVALANEIEKTEATT